MLALCPVSLPAQELVEALDQLMILAPPAEHLAPEQLSHLPVGDGGTDGPQLVQHERRVILGLLGLDVTSPPLRPTSNVLVVLDTALVDRRAEVRPLGDPTIELLNRGLFRLQVPLLGGGKDPSHLAH